MKKTFAYLIPLISLLLVGCNPTDQKHKIDPDKEVIEIYATNDFHGAVLEENGGMGLAKLATFLKEKGEQENTLLLDQGDTWQGSIYSNYNHGGLITDVMNYIHYDARSVGNHDFDWGTEYLATNTAKSYNGYAVPVLAGNVYDYNFYTKQVGENQRSDLGVKSVTYILENGLKVGILGGIGRDQITSISSNYTTEITFTDHIAFIKEESAHLRKDLGCDIVIASIHTGQDSVKGNNLEPYVDLVLCGHTHTEESSHEGKLYYSQNKAYGQSLGHITLVYDKKAKDVTSTNIECIQASKVISSVAEVDSTVQSLINTSNAECQTAADQIVASNVSGSFYSSGALPNLMARAIYDQCMSEGYTDVLLSYVNVARKSKYSGQWTYADLYEAFPFDNIVYIADITGREFKYEVKNYNYIYRGTNFTDTTINDNKTYKLAIIDYVYFHTNANRNYDYFSQTGGTSTTTLSKNYREILRDWLISNGYNTGKQLNANDFSDSLWAHDRDQLPS